MNAIPVRMGNVLRRSVWAFVLGTLACAALAGDQPGFRKAESSFSIVGMVVRNFEDQQLGKVQDLAIDLENGRLVEVIVTSSSGFLGHRQRTVAVPPAALSFDPVSRVVRLDMNREKFKVAPSFEMSQWADHCSSRRVVEVYRYYGEEPYFAADGSGTKTGLTASEPLGYIQPSSKLIGLAVRNLQNELLGRVDTFLFDLASGNVYHVIIEYPGSAQTKNIIQARALKFTAARDALQLDISKEAFQHEPRFQWIHGQRGGFRQEIYSNTAVAANDGLNTKQIVQAGTADKFTPLAQGTGFRDVDKTRRINGAILADASLSKAAQNVEVGTLNGQTTLRGNVNTEAEKRAIGEIAAKAGRPENVSNLLEVRPVSLRGP